MMRVFPAIFVLAMVSACASGSVSAAPKNDLGPAQTEIIEREAHVRKLLEEVSAYASEVLISQNGSAQSDYDLLASEWKAYETHWHTGQLIWGLVEAGLVLEQEQLLQTARRGGDWWVSTAFPEDHPLAGLVAAAHGDKLGDLINWTTISDGTPGLFALSRATGDPAYATTATNAGSWLWENTRVPATVKGGDGLFYNIIDPHSGSIFTDWDVHTQGVPRDPERASVDRPAIERLARPNIEGFLFEDMCRHTGDVDWCERFLAQADGVLARQHESGIWLEFEPNVADGSQVHPRFNTWNAEALLQAYHISLDPKYLEGAARTARWAQSVMAADGTFYYRTSLDGSVNRAEITGSAVAFNAILMLRLKDYGYDEFAASIDTLVTWIEKNRFSPDHPDTNLAGAVIDTRQKMSDGRLNLINRGIGTSFAMRFLALYLRDLRGEDVNAYLNKEPS
jgi:hypothetical protein